MSSKQSFTNKENEKEFPKTYERFKQTVPNLSKSRGWMLESLVQFQGCWMSPNVSLMGLFLIQDHFKTRPDDVFLASFPKTGTTWLKALIFTTVNRSVLEFSTHPLLKNHAQYLLPYLEPSILPPDWASRMESLPSPRLFSTHLPHALLPESMTSSGCKFVYVCREPKDVLVSLVHYVNNYHKEEGQESAPASITMEEAFDLFCQGKSPYGPYWDHVLGYWKASKQNPNEVLILKYEDLKKGPLIHVRKLARFLGQPFSEKEENEGVIEEIIKLCSFETLSNLEVNKSSERSDNNGLRNKDFFRKGETGDWKNHITLEMAACIDHITEEKLRGSGFSFGCSP